MRMSNSTIHVNHTNAGLHANTNDTSNVSSLRAHSQRGLVEMDEVEEARGNPGEQGDHVEELGKRDEHGNRQRKRKRTCETVLMVLSPI